MIQSLDRGLRILDEIVAGRRSLGEISESLGVHKSTAVRLLATLEQHHFVARADERRYELGPRVVDLAQFQVERADAAGIAALALHRLVADLGMPGHIAAFTESDAVVTRIQNSASRSCSAQLGDVLSMTSSAPGLVLLAALPSGVWRPIALGENPSDPDRVLAELAEVRRTGIAQQRLGDDLTQVSAALHDATGRTTAAITLEVPPDETASILPALMEATDRADSAARI